MLNKIQTKHFHVYIHISVERSVLQHKILTEINTQEANEVCKEHIWKGRIVL